jgi:hypothetical protein
MKKPHWREPMGFFLFGGLGRNRTIDTRIFNAVLKTKDIVFQSLAAARPKWCAYFVRLQTLEQSEHRS